MRRIAPTSPAGAKHPAGKYSRFAAPLWITLVCSLYALGESSFPHAAQRTERDGRGADDEENHVAHLRSLWKVPPSGTSSGATIYWRSALDCMFSILVLMVAPSSVVVRAFQRTSNTSHMTSSPSKMPICGLQITASGVRTPKPWNIVM